MVYKYKRKTQQANWSEDVMKTAIEECNSGSKVKFVAGKCNLPYSTLGRHVKSASGEKTGYIPMCFYGRTENTTMPISEI